MPIVSLHQINTTTELRQLMNYVEKVKLYGAGYYLTLFAGNRSYG